MSESTRGVTFGAVGTRSPVVTTDWRRLRLALAMLASVFVVGTIGYVILGFPLLDAVYQTVTTVATVGFREVRPLDDAGKVFTIILILVGVGTALYTFSVVLETLFEGAHSRALRETTHGPTDRRNERPRHRVRLGSRSDARSPRSSVPRAPIS